MPKWGYSIIQENLNPEKTAKASGRELKVSHKAAQGSRSSPKRHGSSHKPKISSEMLLPKTNPSHTPDTPKNWDTKAACKNAGVGRYPIKCADAILRVLQAAQANAENKGLDVDRLRIMHSAAYPGMKLKRYTPRAHGRASPKYEITTHVEIVLEEKPPQESSK